MIRKLLLTLFLALSLIDIARAQAPAYDHIVIVIEENHGFSQIIGSSSAPNINALAASGANIVNAATDPQGNTSGSHAVRHPSQPNYLELYSGSNQGTVQDGHPGDPTSEPFSSPPPFTTPNLGAALRNAGFSFATYSQTMPSVGFDGDSAGAYQRKHNPVANWMNDVNPTANQLPSTVNQPFTTFQQIASSPGGFANLPTVSFVVPDQNFDMHDGTIQAADTWLKQNIIDTYLPWAMTHNSLLIVTWDEDGDNTATNQIATIFAGSKIKPGNYTETNLNANNPHVASPTDPPPAIQTPTGTAMNHYNVLSTIEDIYGLEHIAGSMNRRPVSDIFTMSIFPGPLVVPNDWANAFGDAGNLFPLFSSQPIRYQQVFDAAQFSRLNPGGGLINRIAFRGHGPGVPFTANVPQLQVNLSTTSKTPDALSSAFAENVGGDDTQVFSGPLQTAVTFTGGPTNFEVVLNFTTPFFYDPSKGNLLLDVRNVLGATEVPPSDQELDGTSANGDSVSRVYNFGDVAAASAGKTGGVDEKDTFGLITHFNAINAVSRKVHGTAGAFDIGLPLVGRPGIECRTGGTTNDYQVVMTFGGPVTFTEAKVTQGTGTVTTTTMNNNQVFINLTGVTNEQTIKITLFAVNDGTGTNNVTIPMSILIGDTTDNGAVNSSDVAQTQSQSGQILTTANFRTDVTANGAINSGDIALVQSKSGTGISSGTAPIQPAPAVVGKRTPLRRPARVDAR
ncbi:MAG TPA: alkaline phosphatase family protein [Chthoniobacterales bacterium]|jgi:acid phosphatase|nr:alkaline phosphatase family protein [Chthoniobacterales bacterium]